MIRHDSPNHGPRRAGQRPRLIVLHYTAMDSAKAALERLSDPAFEVSAHYLIGRCGTVWSLVPEARRAWHAGAGAWGSCSDVNSASIGVEIDNDGASPFAEPAMNALESLLPGVMARWDIPPAGIIGHQDLAPGRKIDPGPRFDWRRLALQGLAVWPDGAGGEAPFMECAHRFGYRGDGPAVLAAFRARFRPQAKGPEDAVDRRLMAALARQGPCVIDPEAPAP